MFEQASAGREVLFVCDEVLRQVIDAHAEECDLIVCAAGVSFVELELFWIDGGGAHGRVLVLEAAIG